MHLRWWRPAFGLEPRAELGQRLGRGSIGLGAFEQGVGERVGLGGIDHRDSEAGSNQAAGQTHPIGAGGFHHNEDGVGIGFDGEELTLEEAFATVLAPTQPTSVPTKA